jgi:hypothetical protein
MVDNKGECYMGSCQWIECGEERAVSLDRESG